MYCEYGASRAAFSVFIIKGWVANKFVVSKCLLPYGLDVAVLGFG